MKLVADRLTDLVVRIKRRRKLLAIGLAVLLPVFVLSGVVIQDSMEKITFAEKELTGIDYLRRTWTLLSVCDARIQPVRSGFGAVATENKLARLEAEGVAMATALSGPKSCDQARSFLRRVADESNLMLDPSPDTYNLVHLAVVDLPNLSRHTADPHAPPASVERIAEASQSIDDSLQRAIRVSDTSLRAALTLPSATLSRAVSRHVSQADGEAGELRGAMDNLWVVSVNQLERLLNLRVADAWLKLWLSLALAFLLAAAALAGLIYYDLYVEREEVIKLNAILRQSNEELERFAYICSHDMQEPVRMMNAYAGMLLEDSRDQLDEVGRRHLDYIAANARVMKQMIQDILHFCRIGRDPLQLVEVDSNAVLAQVLNRLAPDIAEAAARVEVMPLPKVLATEGVIQIVLQNLVGNAIKFRHNGVPPDIRISVQDDGGMWRFEVTDNGIGIDEAYRKEVFAVFQRLNRRDDYPGHGLGLSTCRKLLNLIGGEIDFRSTPGTGTIFYFTVPKSQHS